MSGALDVKARKTAEALLSKFGKVATYVQIENANYNPATGAFDIVENEVSITCYISKPTAGEIQAGLATADDAIILVSALELGLTPKNEDLIVFSDKTYTIKKSHDVYSGEEIALHKLVSVIR